LAPQKSGQQVKANSNEEAVLDEAARIMANADAVLARFEDAIAA